MIKLVFAAVIAYFLGNISPSIMISKLKGGDIRKEGSGNAGTTNMLRTYGKKAALITLAIDVAKGASAVLIGRGLSGEKGACICAVCVMIGHIWPALHHFKGGKGVAACLGALLALNPAMALAELLIALIIMAVTKMVSAGSVTAAALIPAASLVFKRDFLVWSVIMAAIVIFKHRSNISRILSGTESRLDFSKYKK